MSDRWHELFARVRGSLHDMGLRTDSDRALRWVATAQQVYGFPFGGSVPRVRDLPEAILEKFAAEIERVDFSALTKKDF